MGIIKQGILAFVSEDGTLVSDSEYVGSETIE